MRGNKHRRSNKPLARPSRSYGVFARPSRSYRVLLRQTLKVCGAGSRICIPILFILFFAIASSELLAQITSAKITFERRTNLYKKFSHEPRITDWVKEEEK